MFEIMSRYFWAVAIVMTGINVAVFKVRARRHVQNNLEHAEGCATLLRGALFWLSIPLPPID